MKAVPYRPAAVSNPSPFLSILLLLFCSSAILSAAKINSEFTFQGRLSDGDGPANGVYDMWFELHDSRTNNLVIGSPMTKWR